MDRGRIGEEEKKRGEKQRSNPCCQNGWIIQGREAGGRGGKLRVWRLLE